MKANKLVLAAILACAGMASTAALAEDKSLMHKMTPAKEMPAKAQSAKRWRVVFAQQCHRVAQLAAVDGSQSARKGRPHRCLDLYLHQLAAYAFLCPRLGGEVQGPRLGGDRGARARIPLREKPRQRSSSCAGNEPDLPNRGRQRLCDLAGVQKPVLAGSLFCRCAGSHAPSSLRRGQLRYSRRNSCKNC